MTHAIRGGGRRRTFAIISHPDAGKTTLTEKFLLYGGAVQEAGAVKARGERRRVRSDWMEMEQKRGISITSTVLQFPYRDHVLNLLDTPGHRDFSEDTYRVLAAADAAVMVLDAAKGIEPQTRKLFEVCRDRGRAAAHVHQQVGPARPPAARAARRDRVAAAADADAGHVAGGLRRGLRRPRRSPRRRVHPLQPGGPGRRRGGRGAPRARRSLADAGRDGEVASEELDLLDAVGHDLDLETFLDRRVDAGVLRLGPHQLRRAPAPRRRRRPRALAVAPRRRATAPSATSTTRSRRSCSRCRPTWIRRTATASRSCGCARAASSGAWSSPTGPPASRSPRSTPTRCSARSARRSTRPSPATSSGWSTPPACGSATRCTPTTPVEFPGIPSFAPELFASIRARDTGRFKQFRSGIRQLDEEGVVQVLRDPDLGDQAPMLAAVGQMQFEVAVHRLEHEFGAPVELTPTSYKVARVTDEASAPALRAMSGVRVLQRADGATAGPVREPVLAGPGRGRPARAAPRPPGGRGLAG